ncbi:uncharacterized protein LOC143246396 [Tachypleus tridentatus]|uniref:uncharacterized protein LOC143246396 n=1 Tax=Tachypleus tridentatus TaxID=6853 RepID=UPI003FD103F6
MELDHGIKDVHQVVATFLKTLECVICLDLLQDPVSTNCHHQFCRKCILKVLQTKFQAPCPLCKAPMTKRSLREKTQLGEVIGAVKELASAVKNDTGIEVTPPRDPLPSTSSPEGRSRMQLFHIAHPSPIKPTVMKRQLCESTSTEAREQSRCTRQRRKRQRLINVMIHEDKDTIEDTMAHPTWSTNINIQSDFPVTRRKHKTMTRSCVRTKGRSNDEEADNDKNTVKTESNVRVSRDAGVTLEQQLHPNNEEHCESKNSASRQKSNNDKTSDISQELLKSHLQNSDFVPCDLETHKNTCLKPDLITNVAMSSDKKTKTKQTKIQTFISSNYKDKENISGLTSNVTKYSEDVLVFPAEVEETVTKNIDTVQRNYISTSEEQPTRDISSKIQKTFDLDDRLNNIQVRRNFSFRKDYTRHKKDHTICKKHKKDKHFDSNQKVEEWLVQCLNSFAPVEEQEKKPADILESVDLKILNDRNASIDDGLTESCAAWKNSESLNKSNTITTFCCPQRSINLGETKEVHEETSIQSLKKRRLEYFCDVNDLKCQSSTATVNLKEVTENNPTVTENKENNCMSATKKVLWQRKKEIKSPLAERNKDDNIYMNADKQELKVMSMHVNELLCEQPIEKKNFDDGNKDIFNPMRNKDAFCAENDDYNTLDDYYFFCTPAFTLPVECHEVNQRNRLRVPMEGVDDLAISRKDEMELEQTSEEKFEDITTNDKKLEIKTGTDEENKIENHENSVLLHDHLSGIPCEIQQNTDKSENGVSIIRKQNSSQQEIFETLEQQETKLQKNSTQEHFETTSVSDETDNTVPVELYPVTSDETDAFSVVSNPYDKNYFPDETRNLETKVKDKDDFSLQERAVDANSFSKVGENNHESNFNPSCQKDNARKSEVLQKICSRNTGQHDDAFTIKQGTKEQVMLGNLNTSQNFMETTDSLAASRTPPQAAASFRLVSLLNQEESRKVHSKPSAAQVSVISESNLEKRTRSSESGLS